MTAVLRPAPRPRRTPARSGQPPSRGQRAGGRGPRSLEPSPLVTAGAEVALFAVSAAAVLSLARLFSDGAFVGPVLLAVAGSHAVAWACRRRGLGLLAWGLLSGLGLALALAWLVEPHTTSFGIPGGATWTAIGDDLRHAWDQFGEVKAPTVPLRGFVLASVLAAWLVAAAADGFAFRMRARFEAVAPSFTLFVFGSILGADNFRLTTTTFYLAAVLAFVLWSEAARRSGTGAWFAGRTRDGDLAVLRQGTALGLAALAVALLIGPHLPGAGSSGLVSWRDGKDGRSRSRVTVSPLVDIRGRLVDQANVELFTVRSDAPSYWRLTSLERFDGSIWSSLGTYQSSKGALGGGSSVVRDSARPIAQDYAIGPLGTIWLPAAYIPERVSGVKGARYDKDSSSLLADASTADSLRYQVVSAQPQLTPAQIIATAGPIPADVADRYLDLPADFPPDVAAEARRQTADAVTPYGKAKALQDWFRRDFVYDTDIPAGHDNNAMRRFLAVRRGYCEQFAGTYAAMARVLGIPARVAVGFVPGTQAADGRFHVAGGDAHAWPEVYLGGVGWVSFEPTPGRASPGAEQYTGVPPPGQDDQTDSTTPTTAPSSTTPASKPAERESEEAPQPRPQARDGSGLGPLALFVLGLLGLVAAFVGGVPLGRRWVVNRRRAAAVTPSDRVLVAWQEAEEALGHAGHARRASETAAEYAARAGSVAGPAEPDLVRLAGTTTAAGFSPEGVPPPEAAVATEAAASVERALRAQASRARRLWWTIDPTPLIKALRRGPRPRQEGG